MTVDPAQELKHAMMCKNTKAGISEGTVAWSLWVYGERVKLGVDTTTPNSLLY